MNDITGKLTVEASPSTERFSIPRAEWDAMTPRQRAELLHEMATDHMNNAGGYGYHLDDLARWADLEDK